jgi:putative FmdB family regulatory protein
MPIFEYHCESCGCDFEKLLFTRRPTVPCTSCGSDRVKRKPSSFGTSGTEKKVSSGASCSSCSAGSCAGCASH